MRTLTTEEKADAARLEADVAAELPTGGLTKAFKQIENEPVSFGVFARMIDQLTVEIKRRDRERKALEDRIAALEAAPQLEYRGTWEPGVTYRRNSAVTAAGGVWIAKADTDTRPGPGAEAWQLAVKRGRDGKDAR